MLKQVQHDGQNLGFNRHPGLDPGSTFFDRPKQG
jgi:hypothetical protein